jgi:hypothetical protein
MRGIRPKRTCGLGAGDPTEWYTKYNELFIISVPNWS